MQLRILQTLVQVVGVEKERNAKTNTPHLRLRSISETSALIQMNRSKKCGTLFQFDTE